MGSERDARLKPVDRAMLTPVVRRALGSETVHVSDWHCQETRGGVGAGTVVYRFAGQAQDGDQVTPWSLILKVLHPVPGRDDPSHWFYWKREAEAYRSGWLDDLPGGITAPRCFGVEEMPDGSYWLWLEEVKDEIGRQWPLEHYGMVARHLGQFNGAYLTGEPMPTWPWLSRDGIRRHLEFSAPAIEQIRRSQDHPLVRRWFARGVDEKIYRLWADRQKLLDVLDRLPQTVCHHDAFRRNLFARPNAAGEQETVIIDWSYAGQGPIGAELVPLVTGTLFSLKWVWPEFRNSRRSPLRVTWRGCRMLAGMATHAWCRSATWQRAPGTGWVLSGRFYLPCYVTVHVLTLKRSLGTPLRNSWTMRM